MKTEFKNGRSVQGSENADAQDIIRNSRVKDSKVENNSFYEKLISKFKSFKLGKCFKKYKK